jgi:hypothetical protein
VTYASANGTVAVSGSDLDSLPNPSRVFQIYEDWMCNSQLGAYAWNNSGAGAAATVNPVAGRPGILQLTCTSANYSTVRLDTATIPNMLLGGGAISIKTSLLVSTALPDGSNSYAVTAGVTDLVAVTNGVYFFYDQADSHWICRTTAAGATTSTTSSVTVAQSTWYKLQIEINAGATSVVFKIDDATVATHATNIPAAAVSPSILNQKTVGTSARRIWIDYYSLRQVLTNAR